MDHINFNTLYKAMHRIIAKDMLRSFTVSDYPYISNARQKRKLHKDVYKIGFPENFEKKVLKTTDLELV